MYLCINLKVLILFNMADHLPHEYSLQKKSPALYNHSLPGADCADSADWGADDQLHIGTRV